MCRGAGSRGITWAMAYGFPDSYFVQAVLVRKRLFLSVGAGGVLGLLLPHDWRWASRLLTAWDFAAALYIGFTARLIYVSTIDDCHRRAAAYDDRDKVILLLLGLKPLTRLVSIFDILVA